MKRILLIGLLVCAASLRADEMEKVRVTGDRVSLRSEPNLERSEVLDRAMSGQEFEVLGREEGWVAIQAPAEMNFWVSAQYLTNGVVVPNKLNVRSGPSKNYNTVAVLERDQKVELRGDFNGWAKIAPPPGSRVWISAEFVETIQPPTPVEPVLVEKKAETPAIVYGSAKSDALKPLVLVRDETKTQGQPDEIAGVLKRANPGLFKLVLIAGEIEEPICLVRGNVAQLEKYVNRALLIKGHIYWAKDVDLPVLQPQTIIPDPLLKSR
jgi:hypothetical protein